MDAKQIRASLERALHTRITAADWMYLEDVGLIRDYEVTGDWPELRDGVDDNLSRIRAYHKNKLSEQAGELGEEPRQVGAERQQPPPVPVDLQGRTLARSLALGALNNLRSGGSAPPRATMTGTLLPRGGVDGTVPQFVWVMAAELWIPAEEVARSFRKMQRHLMVGVDRPTRTKARAFEVARFVWDVEASRGECSWPVLCRLWNDRCRLWNDSRRLRPDLPVPEPFDNWRDFRTYFKRGESATLPRYKATDEEITEQVRVATARGEAVACDAWVRQVLAATVQQDSEGQ